jgi:hypothetical protein
VKRQFDSSAIVINSVSVPDLAGFNDTEAQLSPNDFSMSLLISKHYNVPTYFLILWDLGFHLDLRLRDKFSSYFWFQLSV